MRQACFAALVALGLAVSASATLADDFDISAADMIDGMRPVMVPLDGREPLSDDEWEALQEGSERAVLTGLFGKLGDLKRQTISFMDTRYFTPNSAEGTLASYGKMDTKNRFDRYGH